MSPPSHPRATKRRFRSAAVVLVGLLGLAALLWVLAPAEAPAPGVSEPLRKTPRSVASDPVGEVEAPAGAPDLDPDALAEAASGELGLVLRNRVCALCEAGVAELGEACRHCLGAPHAGRVVLDVVGSDGRPFPDHDVMVRSDCGRGGTLGTGFLDLREGECTLTAVRVDGPFDVAGPSRTVQVVAGEEQYVLLEIPSERWGGVGVTLEVGEDGPMVQGLLPNAASTDQLGEGAVILTVDGAPVSEWTAAEVGRALAGPVGSEVEIRVGYEGEDGWEEETLRIERARIEAADVGLGKGPPG